jgi:uncharacterized protein (TIGR02266 family)
MSTIEVARASSLQPEQRGQLDEAHEPVARSAVLKGVLDRSLERVAGHQASGRPPGAQGFPRLADPGIVMETATITGTASSVMVAGAERRQVPRVEAVFDVTLESEHNFFTGFSENLSEGGVFVAAWAFSNGSPPVHGDRIHLTFTLPDGGSAIEVTAEVRWARAHNELSDTPPALGLRFLDLGDEHRQRIEGFVRSRDPLFYPD